jgi:hypothetical protein
MKIKMRDRETEEWGDELLNHSYDDFASAPVGRELYFKRLREDRAKNLLAEIIFGSAKCNRLRKEEKNENT